MLLEKAVCLGTTGGSGAPVCIRGMTSDPRVIYVQYYTMCVSADKDVVASEFWEEVPQS